MKAYSIIILIGIGFYSQAIFSQQDVQYTQYMYNTLSINPAYAGSRDGLSILGLHRNQWVGLKGAPETRVFSMHSPLGERIGLGINIQDDQVFVTREVFLDFIFSYKIFFSANSQLSFGIKGGLHAFDLDHNKAITGPYDVGDRLAKFNVDKKFSPHIGVGVYYYTDRFYLGLSVPNLLTTDHFDDTSIEHGIFTSVTAEERLHYNLMSGYVFELGQDIKFKPSTLIKWVSGAPLQVDISTNFLLYDKVTIGAAYRWGAALSGLVGLQITQGLMVGFAYDRDTTELKRFNDGTYEVFLRFEIFKKADRMLSPRFF